MSSSGDEQAPAEGKPAVSGSRAETSGVQSGPQAAVAGSSGGQVVGCQLLGPSLVVAVSGVWLTLEASGRWLVRGWWRDKTCGLNGRF